MHSSFDVVVVGAGIFGLAAASELALRGKRVAIIDRFGSGHPATSSTGRSRGIRIAYDHPFYVTLALDAIRRWRALEDASGEQILHLTGQVDFGLDNKLAAIAAAVREAGGVIDELDSAGLSRKLPHLLGAPEDNGLFHAQAGTVLSDNGMAALKAKVLAQGVASHAPERVVAIEPGNPTLVVTEKRRIHAETVVIAAGPWSGALLDELGIVVPLAPSIAQVTFIAAPELVDQPGIGEWGGDGEGLGGVYGHPVPGVGYKLAFSTGQEGWSPDVSAWQPDLQEQARLFAWLDRRMPAFPRQVQLAQRHPWTMTPDGDFIVDRVGPVVLACGCSGHAFKFGPALGPLVADAVDGKTAHPLLRLDRPSLRGRAAADDAISR
ncbi:FAD-dependent oxidoreductase [Aestuariivirga sp. YIM B02566]|uniref:FAD-dependent oxidoreductase n=1 Tax=Taklimakanibacter albus TaxID=2800327 RepID=A0ACC5QX68_9HYPH|nr:FAD-dependent oxidoreductase [Aestuariivirga sp. YIM B02566]MBK1864960.1 FAD-dependent oxidoreductase [Aestuariivirga sp. YIM B02566]